MKAQDHVEFYDKNEELKHHLGLDDRKQVPATTTLQNYYLDIDGKITRIEVTNAKLQEKHAQLKTDSPYQEFTTTKREVYLLVLFCLGFAGGCVFMLLSGLLATVVE